VCVCVCVGQIREFESGRRAHTFVSVHLRARKTRTALYFATMDHGRRSTWRSGKRVLEKIHKYWSRRWACEEQIQDSFEGQTKGPARTACTCALAHPHTHRHAYTHPRSFVRTTERKRRRRRTRRRARTKRSLNWYVHVRVLSLARIRLLTLCFAG
jgi:hypothetical protein